MSEGCIGKDNLTAEWLAQEQEIARTFFSKKNLKDDRGSPVCQSTDCDQYARRLLGTDDIRPVDNQGANSYTVICPSQSKIVQFRLKPFKDDIFHFAHQLYGEISPEIERLDDFVALSAYLSTTLRGKVHVLQPFPKDKPFPLEREKKTVIALAEIVALSAYFPQPKTVYSTNSWTRSARSTLSQLLVNDNLRNTVPKIIEKVAALYDELHLLNELPAVLTHPDFTQLNILVDDDGSVTGVIDFDEAEFEALGMCNFGLY